MKLSSTVCVAVSLCSIIFMSHFRHGEDLIVTPFAQVRADYKSVNLLQSGIFDKPFFFSKGNSEAGFSKNTGVVCVGRIRAQFGELCTTREGYG